MHGCMDVLVDVLMFVCMDGRRHAGMDIQMVCVRHGVTFRRPVNNATSCVEVDERATVSSEEPDVFFVHMGVHSQ